jgi:DNA polymerase alpha subunit B
MALKIEHDADTIREAFAASNIEVSSDAIHTCIAICTEFALTADELAARYDAYSMNHQVSGAVDGEKLAVFRSKLSQEKAKGRDTSGASSAAQKRKIGKISGTPVIKREIKTESQDPLSALYNMTSPDRKHPPRSFTTPAPSNGKVARTSSSMFSPTSMQSPPGSSSYENRSDAGKIVTEFNAHLKPELVALQNAAALEDDPMSASTGVAIRVPFEDRNMKSKAEFMYTPLFDRALALDEQLVEYEELVKSKYELESLGQIGDPSPAQVTIVGRIVCEAAEGKLNPSVVQLEGSRKSCGGQRVLLDLSGVPSLQVFPGKVGPLS